MYAYSLGDKRAEDLSILTIYHTVYMNECDINQLKPMVYIHTHTR